jgi:hypothetical protein
VRIRAALAILTLALPLGVLRAETPPAPDALSEAYYAAERNLQAGKEAALRAAIAKARAWWEADGNATYTFDNIERNLMRDKAPTGK